MSNRAGRLPAGVRAEQETNDRNEINMNNMLSKMNAIGSTRNVMRYLTIICFLYLFQEVSSHYGLKNGWWSALGTGLAGGLAVVIFNRLSGPPKP